MIKKFLFVLVAVALVGCTDSDVARKSLAGAGYTDIEITGYAFFGCSEDDAFHTGFKAKGLNGQPVEGVVCSGWLKGSTIRLD